MSEARKGPRCVMRASCLSSSPACDLPLPVRAGAEAVAVEPAAGCRPVLCKSSVLQPAAGRRSAAALESSRSSLQ